MKNTFRPLVLSAALYAGLLVAVWGQPVPPPLSPLLPLAPRDAPRDPTTDARREYWRNLSPEQRDSIRRLSQEQRQALLDRPTGRAGEPPLPAARLSREERRQLRAQIREEHERRGPRAGGSRRP